MLTMTLVYVFGVALFAGFLQTLTGFGYALVAAPLLALVLNPKDVVMFVLCTGMIIKSVMAWQTRHEGRFRDILLIFLASLIGALPGTMAMAYISSNMLKVLIGVVLIGATVLMYSEVKVKIIRHKLTQVIVGLVSGFSAATTSISGPPLVFYYMNEDTSKEILRANLSRYFVLNNGVSLMLAWMIGTLDVGTLAVNTAVSIPGLLLGVWLGEGLFAKIDASLFRKLALAVISVSGVVAIVSGVWNGMH